MQVEPGHQRPGDGAVQQRRKFYEDLVGELITFAEAQFALSAPQEDSQPLRVHLESLERQGNVEAAWRLANPPPLPPLAAHLWGYFLTLSNTRASNGLGPSRLSRLEIRAWEEDEMIRLEPWERRALQRLDGAWITSIAETQAQPAKEA